MSILTQLILEGRIYSSLSTLNELILEAFGEALGGSGGAFGEAWGGLGSFGSIKMNLGATFGRLWETLGDSGGGFGETLGRLCEASGSFGRRWGSLWEVFGRLWGSFGSLSEPFFSSRLLFLPYI